MVAPKTRLRAAARRAVHAIAPGAIDSVSEIPQLTADVRRMQGGNRSLRREVRGLRSEVNALRAEVQETRRLHQRVAELTDVVADVLVAAVDSNDPKVRKALDEFATRAF